MTKEVIIKSAAQTMVGAEAAIATVAVKITMIVAATRDVVVAIKTKESRKRCRKTIGLSYLEESRPSGPSTSSIPNLLIGIMMPPRNTIMTLTGMAARGIGGAEKSSVMPFKWRRRSVTNAKVSRIISNIDNLPCLRLQLVILKAKATMANHPKVSR